MKAIRMLGLSSLLAGMIFLGMAAEEAPKGAGRPVIGLTGQKVGSDLDLGTREKGSDYIPQIPNGPIGPLVGSSRSFGM